MSEPRFKTREEWLVAGVEELRCLLDFAGAPRVSVGFPSSGGVAQRKKKIGQCWDGACAADGIGQVFISPLLSDPVEVLATLLHEVIHFKIGCAAKHGGLFKREMKKCGLEGKATATVPSAQCAASLAAISERLGPYPHAALTPGLKVKPQGTRLLKVQCPQCECVLRITAKWAGENGETAPFCGYCGLDDNPDTMVRMVLA